MKKTGLLLVMLIATSTVNAQWSVHAFAGANFNATAIKDIGAWPGTTPKGSDVYQSAVGFSGGVITRYAFDHRTSLSGELAYQQMPFRTEHFTGTFYESYGSLLVCPAYRFYPWLAIEGGLGGAVSIEKYSGERNDPVFWMAGGLSFPLRRVEIKARYYRFLTPATEFSLGGSPGTRSLYSYGLHLSVAYRLWGR